MRRKFVVPDAEACIAGIQGENISNTGRSMLRLQVVLHALQGASSYKTARLYGHSLRSVQYWIHGLISYGLRGL